MGPSTLWSHETVLPAEAVSASEARHFVCFHLVEHHLLYLVEDVRLVVSELVTNAMAHAQAPLTVTMQRGERCVLLTVKDGSPSAPAMLAADLLDMAGPGLSIVGHVSHDWGVTAALGGGKSVWASFATRPMGTAQR